MATSTLRAAIIVAAIVFGGIVLANAFPGGVAAPGPHGSTGPSPSSSAPASPHPSVSPPKIAGAVLQVLNGTTTAHLASVVRDCLVQKAHVVIPDPDNVSNAPEHFATTTLVYKGADKALADALRDRFFPGAKVQGGLVLEQKPDVVVNVIVGADYQPVAECQGIT